MTSKILHKLGMPLTYSNVLCDRDSERGQGGGPVFKSNPHGTKSLF